jgi:hypothetical protein
VAERVCITGSRGPNMPTFGFIGPLTKAQSQHLERLNSVRRYISTLNPDTVVVTGTAKGVDFEARMSAKASGLSVSIVYPQLGAGAALGQKRVITETSDRAVVWWDGKSRGSGLFIDMFQRSGKELILWV